MARPQKEPLRPLTTSEREELAVFARSRSAPADRIARARAILAVNNRTTFGQAAQQAGWRRHQSVADLVARFNQDGMLAIYGRHGGGPAIQYGIAEQERILKEFQRPPDREKDQTATRVPVCGWLATLQRALRQAPDGLPRVSTYVIVQALHQAGYSWQKDCTWCHTGTVERKRKDGVVTVTDPVAEQKSGSLRMRIA